MTRRLSTGASPSGLRMTRAEKAAWKRIHHYRRLMSLLTWELRVPFGRDDENFGKNNVANQYKEADLSLDLNRHETPDRHLDITIRHELAHMILGPISAFAMKLCKGEKMLLDMLDDVEDEVATHISRMKIFEE